MREKLIELLSEHCAFKEKGCVGCDTDGKCYRPECRTNLFGKIANHLIANGVTIQKWIPVTERLPEMHTKVLCCGIRGGRFIAELSTWGNGNLYWDKRNGKGCPEVTHWMPLPEPPNGERKDNDE